MTSFNLLLAVAVLFAVSVVSHPHFGSYPEFYDEDRYQEEKPTVNIFKIYAPRLFYMPGYAPKNVEEDSSNMNKQMLQERDNIISRMLNNEGFPDELFGRDYNSMEHYENKAMAESNIMSRNMQVFGPHPPPTSPFGFPPPFRGYARNFMNDGPMYDYDGPEYLHDGPDFMHRHSHDYMLDAPSFMHGSPDYMNDGPEYRHDGADFMPDSLDYMNDSPDYMQDGSEFIPDYVDHDHHGEHCHHHGMFHGPPMNDDFLDFPTIRLSEAMFPHDIFHTRKPLRIISSVSMTPLATFFKNIIRGPQSEGGFKNEMVNLFTYDTIKTNDNELLKEEQNTIFTETTTKDVATLQELEQVIMEEMEDQNSGDTYITVTELGTDTIEEDTINDIEQEQIPVEEIEINVVETILPDNTVVVGNAGGPDEEFQDELIKMVQDMEAAETASIGDNIISRQLLFPEVITQ